MRRALLIMLGAFCIAAVAVKLDVSETPALHFAQDTGLTCGISDNQKKALPTDWTSFAAPRRGQSYVDAQSGCTIVRLTDSATDGVSEHHYYSTLTPMSADDSKLLINDEHGGWHVVDRNGNVIITTSKMPERNSGVLVWDADDGSSFYFTYENRLMKGTVIGPAVKTATVHTFQEYRTVMLPDKTDLSIDGNSFAMWGGHTAGLGPLDIFTYNMHTDNKRAPYTTNCSQIVSYIQGDCVHGLTQTADDNVIIGFARDGTCRECGNRLWTDGKLVDLQDITNHIDTGFDLSGQSIFIELGGHQTLSGERNPCKSGWGLDVRRLNDMAEATCLLDKQPSWHVSYRGSSGQPWVALSFFEDSKSGPELFNSSAGFQPPTWANWQLYEDEIVLARIDGGAIYRLGYARSRSDEGYWATPRAAISRDGKYVIFDSNMAYAQDGCPSGLEDCSDVYSIKVR